MPTVPDLPPAAGGAGDLPDEVASVVRRVIVAASSGDYPGALALLAGSRCSATGVARAVAEYGQAFSAPPFADWTVVPVASGDDDGARRWSVRAPFWSEREGGRSDLELFLSAAFAEGRALVELDDVRVA